MQQQHLRRPPDQRPPPPEPEDKTKRYGPIMRVATRRERLNLFASSIRRHRRRRRLFKLNSNKRLETRDVTTADRRHHHSPNLFMAFERGAGRAPILRCAAH